MSAAPWWDNVQLSTVAVRCVRCSHINELRMVGDEFFCRSEADCDRRLREQKVRADRRPQHPDHYRFGDRRMSDA